jgi:hypothetical protein
MGNYPSLDFSHFVGVCDAGEELRGSRDGLHACSSQDSPRTISKNNAQMSGSGLRTGNQRAVLHDAAELDLSDHAAAPA